MVQQLLLLGILVKEKMHGYRLNEYVRHAMSLYTNLKKATVYYTLEKLEKECYVEHEVEKEGKRPERYVYQITKKGRAYFLDILREHLRKYARTYYEDDVGIAFMDQLSTVEVRRLLTEKRKKIKDLLQQFRDVPAEHPEPFGYVIQHNIVHLEADLTWLNDILRKLDSTTT